jgi:hypothetical protein
LDDPTKNINSFKNQQHIQVANGIYLFKMNYQQGQELKYQYQKSTPSSEKNGIPIAGFLIPNAPDPNSFNLCSTVRSNLFAQIVGPSAICDDYYANDKRVKTRVWNQNYFLYASVGISVRSQNRWLRIWWEQNINELILGYTYAIFKYPEVSMELPNLFPQKIAIYENKAYTMDSNGFVLPYLGEDPGSIFDQFPINDPNLRLLRVYYWNPFTQQDNDFVELTTGDINKFIANQFKTRLLNIWKTPLTANDPTPTTMFTQFNPNDIQFLYTN